MELQKSVTFVSKSCATIREKMAAAARVAGGGGEGDVCKCLLQDKHCINILSKSATNRAVFLRYWYLSKTRRCSIQ